MKPVFSGLPSPRTPGRTPGWTAPGQVADADRDGLAERAPRFLFLKAAAGPLLWGTETSEFKRWVTSVPSRSSRSLYCHLPCWRWVVQVRWHGEVNCSKRRKTGWWFQTFFIFHNIWDNFSHWLSYFSRWLLHHQPVPFYRVVFLNQKPRSWIFHGSESEIWTTNLAYQSQNPIFSGKIIQIWVGFALQSNFIDWMVSNFFVDHNVVEGPVFMIFT